MRGSDMLQVTALPHKTVPSHTGWGSSHADTYARTHHRMEFLYFLPSLPSLRLYFVPPAMVNHPSSTWSIPNKYMAIPIKYMVNPQQVHGQSSSEYMVTHPSSTWSIVHRAHGQPSIRYMVNRPSSTCQSSIKYVVNRPSSTRSLVINYVVNRPSSM